MLKIGSRGMSLVITSRRGYHQIVTEAEIEGLTVKKGKTRPPRLTHLETSITRHKLHIKKLELILRLLDNDELSPEEGAPVHSLKTSVVTSAPQIPATVASPHHESAVVQDQANDTASKDSNSGIVARTPLAKSSMVGLSAPSTPTGNHAPISVNVQAQTLPGLSAASPTLPGSTSVRGVLENAAPSNPSSPITLGNSMKEEEVAGFPGRISSPSLADAGIARGISRGGLSNQPLSSIPLSPGVVPSNGALGSVPLASDIAKRNILGTDDRLGSGGMVQPLASSSNRMILPQAGKAGDGTGAVDSSSSGEAATMGGRVFSPLVTGMQWIPGSSFQNQNELPRLLAILKFSYQWQVTLHSGND
ncbi:negative regulator of transcription [Salix suchowensis]|nr:negative regulator of transcription [Salix suchowensis]